MKRLFVAAVCMTVTGIVPAHAAPAVTFDNVMVYASIGTDNRVAVIDAATRQVVATIPVGVSPGSGAFATRTSMIYVPNKGSDNVSVINAIPGDPRRHTVVETVDVGSFPTDIKYSAATGKIYVLNLSSDTITVIRASDNAVVKTISGLDFAPLALAMDDRNGRLFVGHDSPGTISVIDTATDAVVQVFRAHPGVDPPPNISDIAVAPGLNRLFVADGSWGDPPPPAFLIIDVAPGSGNTLAGQIELRSSFSELAVNRTETRAYATENSDAPGEADAGVSVINLTTNRRITRVPVTHSSAIDVDPNGMVYIGTDANTRTVAIVSPTTNSVVATVPLTGAVYGFAVSYVQH